MCIRDSPEWEDPKNATGAELTVSTESLEQCDEWWEACLLAIIGNVLPCADELTGVRVIDKSKKGSKPVYRLELWFTRYADTAQLKQVLTTTLGLTESNIKFKLKQHSSQKPLQQAASKQAASKQAAVEPDSAGRIRDLRALLAKLTPERFERLVPQIRGLLGDGSPLTVSAVVQCIKSCSMQTDIFHGMYAQLVAALAGISGVVPGVVEGCRDQMMVHTEHSRHDAKNAASFAAELCARGVVSVDAIRAEMERFGGGHVQIEVMCTLLTRLHPIVSARGQLGAGVGMLKRAQEMEPLPARLKFMVQDVLRLYG
eukprot:TRINITY_DN1160_c0_g1_i2.p1 TRINITY_DN1160_c0_g1~~TRINITY_DN1160_c0_g1_i2.p1  ORF type:complete len:314 (+),score=78.72 TRINITY_DN1160_c0_g1_i2:116-1057(+)